MNDFQDLKAIAEACQQHQPLRFMPSHGALYIRNDNGIVFDVHQNRSFPGFMAQNKDYADLVLAANPATVLALIAEVERLDPFRLDDMEWSPDKIIERMTELKTENGALRKALGDCTASLEGEFIQRYGQKPEDMNPVTRRDYDFDMAEVEGYKALIKEVTA